MINSLTHLPHGLTSISIAGYVTAKLSLDDIASLPHRLVYFCFDNFLNADQLRMLPRSLTTLIFHLANPTQSMMTALPPYLKRLRIPRTLADHNLHSASLPPHLTELLLNTPIPVDTAFVSGLPRSLEVLTMWDDQTNANELLQLLPPRLTKLLTPKWQCRLQHLDNLPSTILEVNMLVDSSEATPIQIDNALDKFGRLLSMTSTHNTPMHRRYRQMVDSWLNDTIITPDPLLVAQLRQK